jgi:cell wall-associated NlpC family hydrolase
MRSRQLTQPTFVIGGRSARPRPASQARRESFATVLARRTARTSAAAGAAAAPEPAGGDAGAAILAAASGQLGGRYVWGGEWPGAFDCSGLVRWAVRQATGQSLPRVAADQARAGRLVDRENLRPGDLVFFENTYGPGITHVGVYAGNGRFVHAASERLGIVTSRLDEPYWAARYAGARRVAG